jgi:uncharacterized protein DUF2188
MQAPGSLTLKQLTVHVIPGRMGSWSVRTDEAAETLSVHSSTTEAERAARHLAVQSGAHHVIVHDRYGRLHAVVVEGAPKEG